MLRLRQIVLGTILSLAILGSGSGQSQEPPAKGDAISKQPTQATAPDERGTEKVPLTVKILPSQPSKEQTQNEERQRREQREKAAVDKRLADETQRLADQTEDIAAYTRILALATLLLFAAALGQIILFWVQLRYIRQAAIDTATTADAAKNNALAAIEANKINRENFVASRRAWLSIDNARLISPTNFTNESFVLSIEATIKILGETPATNVWLSFEPFVAKNNTETFADAEKRFKAALRATPIEWGSTIFPEDTLVQRERSEHPHEKMKDSIVTFATGEKKINFIIFIGVRYRINGDNDPHITYYAHSLMNIPLGTIISESEQLGLPRMPFLAGEAD